MGVLLAIAIVMIPVAAATVLACHYMWERRQERRRRGPFVLASYEPVRTS